MTHTSPNAYTAADFGEPAMLQAKELLTPAAMLSAVGAELAARDKRMAALELELRELRAKLETIERGGRPKLVLPSSPGAMIA